MPETPATPPTEGRVASLHVHPPESGESMLQVTAFNLTTGRGIQEDGRYFGRPTRRQVSLMAREEIAEHAAVLGVESFPPGVVRSNIETEGLVLTDWMGREVEVGEAILFFYAPRTPCHQMDALAQGLKELMGKGHQGVLAQVRRGGKVQAGDPIRLRPG